MSPPQVHTHGLAVHGVTRHGGQWPAAGGRARNLVEAADSCPPEGRLAWRTCTPAVVTAWSEMAREPVLPPAQVCALVRPRLEP